MKIAVTAQHDMAPASVMERAGRDKLAAVFETALIIIGQAALLVLLPHHVFSDGAVRYREMVALLQRHTIPTQKFSIIGPLFSTPVFLVGLLLKLPHAGVGVYNWCVFVAGMAAAYWVLRKHVSHTVIRTFFLLLIAASMFPNHLTNYYGEVFTAICVGVGSMAVVFGPELLGWALLALGVANTPATLVGMACLVAWRMWETKRLRYVGALIAAGGLIALENWIRRGNPLNGGYDGEPGFTYPFFLGIVAILFSFGKGLIFFAPGLLLPVRKHMAALRENGEPRLPGLQGLRSIYLLWIAFVVGLVLIYSRWWAWYGGWWWGPRFFLIASMPASLAIAVRLHRHDESLLANLCTLAALVWSVWVGINGAVFDQNTLDAICLPGQPHADEALCHFFPQYSVLWRPFLVPEPLTLENKLFIAYALVVLVYLAAPLAWRIVRQVGERVRDQGSAYLVATRGA